MEILESEEPDVAERGGMITRRRAPGAGAVTLIGGGLGAWFARDSIVRWHFSRSQKYGLGNDFIIGDLQSGTGLLLEPNESDAGLDAVLRVGVAQS